MIPLIIHDNYQLKNISLKYTDLPNEILKTLNTHHKDSTLFYSKVFFTIKYVNGNGLIATHRRKEIFVALWAIQLFSVCMIITFTFFTWRFFLFKNILITESPIRN